MKLLTTIVLLLIAERSFVVVPGTRSGRSAFELSISATMSKRKNPETGGGVAAKRPFPFVLSSPAQFFFKYYGFTEKTDFYWMQVFFPRDSSQFFVNPGMIGQLSPVLHTLFMDDKFTEAKLEQVSFPEENAADFLVFLQATMPFECYPLKPVLVPESGILLRYAKMWMIDSLKWRCERFLTDEFPSCISTLAETITLLVAVCEFGCDNEIILGNLIGRAAAFGSSALVKAEVHLNVKLTNPSSSLLFLNARKACPGIHGPFNRPLCVNIHAIPELKGFQPDECDDCAVLERNFRN